MPERQGNSAADPSVAARELVQRLTQAGHIAYWAGGCVRDLLMHRPAKDIDVATSARPDEVMSLFPGSYAVGKAFGVVRVRLYGIEIETATFRKDRGGLDGRHPESIEYTDAREDARRRDFTINGMFYDPIAEEIIDYVGGREDLTARTLRAIGTPAARFQEDHLRLLRAVRFASVLDFALDPATAHAIRETAPRLARISVERIQQEFTRMLMESPAPSKALHMLADLDLLRHFLPEVDAMRGVEQPPEYHPEGDVFVHTGLMLDLAQDRSPALMYSILLHDVGKPPTFRVERQPDGRNRIRFDGHDKLGAEMAEVILQRLRLPNALIESVCHAVRNHMRYMHVQEMRKGKLREMVGHAGFPMELELHRVDCLSSHRQLGNYEFLRTFQTSLADEAALPKPLLDGRAVMALGHPAGPALGQLLKSLYEAQLEGLIHDREGAIAWVRAQLGNPADS